MWIVALHVFLRVTLVRSSGLVKLWPVTAVLAAVLWAGMPNPGEIVYWVSGASEYLLGIVVCLFCLAALVATVQRMQGRAAFVAAVVGVSMLAFAAGGIHEVAGMCLLVVLSTGYALASFAGHPSRLIWGAATVACLVGVVLSVAAPGNALRVGQAAEELPVEAAGVMHLLWWQVTDLIIPWITDAKLIALTFLIVAQGPRLELNGLRGDPRSMRAWCYLVPAATVLCVTAGLATPVVLGHYRGPDRLHDMIYVIFVLGWCASVLTWTYRSPVFNAIAVGRVAACAGGLLTIGLLFAPNVYGVAHSLNRPYGPIAWAHHLRQEYARTATAVANGSRHLTLELRLPIPKPYFQDGDGLRAEPDDWRNVCYARYFGLETVFAPQHP